MSSNDDMYLQALKNLNLNYFPEEYRNPNFPNDLQQAAQNIMGGYTRPIGLYQDNQYENYLRRLLQMRYYNNQGL